MSRLASSPLITGNIKSINTRSGPCLLDKSDGQLAVHHMRNRIALEAQDLIDEVCDNEVVFDNQDMLLVIHRWDRPSSQMAAYILRIRRRQRMMPF